MQFTMSGHLKRTHARTLAPVYLFCFFVVVFFLNLRRKCAFFSGSHRGGVCVRWRRRRPCLSARTEPKAFEVRAFDCFQAMSGLNVLLWDLFVCFDIASALFKRPSVVSFFPSSFAFFELAEPRPVCRLAGCRLWDAQTTQQDFPKRGSRR